VINVSVPVNAQPANGTIVTLNANFAGILIPIPISTVRYPTQVTYANIDDVTNGSVVTTYDLGTDPNSAGTQITDFQVTADTGTVRYIKYRITANNGYFFDTVDLSIISLRNITVGANITEHSITDISTDGTVIEYIVKDNSFGSVNPGGSSTVDFQVKAAALQIPNIEVGIYNYSSYTQNGAPEQIGGDLSGVIMGIDFQKNDGSYETMAITSGGFPVYQGNITNGTITTREANINMYLSVSSPNGVTIEVVVTNSQGTPVFTCETQSAGYFLIDTTYATFISITVRNADVQCQ
jgi:hypothetical protein